MELLETCRIKVWQLPPYHDLIFKEITGKVKLLKEICLKKQIGSFTKLVKTLL
jgi:hypothetical protein